MAKSKTDKIRDMLKNGETAANIAKKLKVSKSYVYAVKGRDNKKKGEGKAKKKMTKKAANKALSVELAKLDEGISVPNPLAVQVGGNHYKYMEIQPIEYITANDLGFLEGCIVKRISRWREKENGIEDLEKIKHEVDLLIAAEQGGF